MHYTMIRCAFLLYYYRLVQFMNKTVCFVWRLFVIGFLCLDYYILCDPSNFVCTISLCFCPHTHFCTDNDVDTTFSLNLSRQMLVRASPFSIFFLFFLHILNTSPNASVCWQQLDSKIVDFRTYNIIKLWMRACSCMCASISNSHKD